MIKFNFGRVFLTGVAEKHFLTRVEGLAYGEKVFNGTVWGLGLAVKTLLVGDEGVDSVEVSDGRVFCFRDGVLVGVTQGDGFADTLETTGQTLTHLDDGFGGRYSLICEGDELVGLYHDGVELPI